MSQSNTAPARFGLPILDAAFGGGIPRGSVILIEDEIGVESDLITLNFLTEGLRGGYRCWRGNAPCKERSDLQGWVG